MHVAQRNDLAHACRQLIPLQISRAKTVGGAKGMFICDVIGLQAIQTAKKQKKCASAELVCLQLRLVTCGGIKMSAEAVKVIVRCRPMNDREKKLDCKVRLSSGRTYSARGTS